MATHIFETTDNIVCIYRDLSGVLLRIPRTTPFVLVFCFAGNVKSRSAAGKPITMRENLFVSLLILVWIVVGFSTHILSTDQICFCT